MKMQTEKKMHAGKIGKATCAALVGMAFAAGSLLAEPQTRSDIEDMTVPSGWDASARTTYQVETAEEAFDWFDSRFTSVEEFFFDLNSFPLGFLLFLR